MATFFLDTVDEGPITDYSCPREPVLMSMCEERACVRVAGVYRQGGTSPSPETPSAMGCTVYITPNP